MGGMISPSERKNTKLRTPKQKEFKMQQSPRQKTQPPRKKMKSGGLAKKGRGCEIR